MAVFMTKAFARFADKAKLAGASLMTAAEAVVAGNRDAELGGNVFKHRIARRGAGKSGGFRTIILFRAGGHCFFVHGFAKNDKANVTPKELKALKRLADLLLGLGAAQIEQAKQAGELIEVMKDGDEKEEDGQLNPRIGP